MRRNLKKLHFALLFMVFAMNFQYCVVYQKKPSTFAEASNPKNKKTKITTVNGEMYKFNWFEIEDGYIKSTLNSKRDTLSYKEIDRIRTRDDYHVVLMDSISKIRGNFIIETNNYIYRYFEIERNRDLIIATKAINGDTADIQIPLADIEKIQIVNRNASDAGNLGIGLVCLMGILTGFVVYALSQMY